MPSLSILHGRARIERVLGALVLLGVAVPLALFLGRIAASHYGTGGVELLIGVPLFVAAFRRPGLALVLLLVVVASLFDYSTLPRPNLPGHPPINLADIALAATLGGTLWRRPWRTWPAPVKRYFLVLLAFLALAAVATIKTALVGATPAREALLAYRNFLYLGVAVTLALELTGERWRPTLDAAVAFAGVLSIFAIAGAASHSVAAELQRLSPITIYSPGAVQASGGVALGSTSRVRLTGLFFIYSMLAPTLVMIVVLRDGRRPWRVVAFLLMLAAVGISLNRNMYGGALVAMLITVLLAGARVRGRILLLASLVLVAGTIVVTSSIAPAVTAEVGRRAQTVLSPGQVLKSSSARDRSYEYSHAFPVIAQHPWFGIGPRRFYGAYINGVSGTPRFYVQDLYVDLAADYGIPTAVLFLLVPGVCLAFAGRRLRRLTDPFDRGILAAAIGATIGLLLSCLVDVFGQDPSSTIAIGTSCGFLLAGGMARATITSSRKKGALDVRTT